MIHLENLTMGCGMLASKVSTLMVTISETSKSLKPQLQIPIGMQFGYREGTIFNRSSVVLVESLEEVRVEAGLHLVVAQNGAGKTTVLRTLAGLHNPLKGSPLIGGRLIYISDELEMHPELTPATLFRCWFRRESFDWAIELAERFNLDTRRPIGQLSRGNRQKVLVIIGETLAFESGANLLLLDEPLSGVDSITREAVVRHWTQTSSSLLRLVVMHELEVVKHASSLLTITGGSLQQIKGTSLLSCVEAYDALKASQMI